MDTHFVLAVRLMGNQTKRERIVESVVKDVNFKTGEYKPLVKRNLTEKTTRFWTSSW